MNIERLARAVQANCDVSDAQFAGNYSLCTFLLKMREYFRWERQLPLTQPLDKVAIGAWLSQREQYWDTLGETVWQLLPLNEHTFDPFDTATINAQLTPGGYVYSGGYGLFGKPQFFLADLQRSETIDGVTFHIAEREYARELSAAPAMALGDQVFVRRESLRRFVWERIEEWRWKQNANAPLARAMACYPAHADIDDTLELMTNNETDSAVLHELGEVRAGRLLGPAWEELLGHVTKSKAEFLARAARDHLADCLVTLPTLIERNNDAALHFYFANFNGLRREIFPEAQAAYQRWLSGAPVTVLHDASARGAERWLATAHRLLHRFHASPQNIDNEIETVLGARDDAAVSCAR